MKHQVKEVTKNFNEDGETLLVLDYKPSRALRLLGAKGSEMSFLGKGDNWHLYNGKKIRKSSAASCAWFNHLVENHNKS